MANGNSAKRGNCHEQADKTLRRLHALDVLRLQPFVTGDDLERNLVSFVQGFEPTADNGRVMHKNVLPRILGDEAKPFFIVEPLYFSASHKQF
jgi:hypothetical protein